MYHVRKPKIAMLVEATISALNQEQGVGFDREAPVSNVIPIEAAGRDSLRKAGAGLVESAAQTDHIDQARNQVEDSYEFRDAA